MSVKAKAICACACVCVIIIIVIIVVAVSAGVSCEYYAERKRLNQEPGVIHGDFKRVLVTPRPDYQTKVESNGLIYHDEPAI